MHTQCDSVSVKEKVCSNQPMDRKKQDNGWEQNNFTNNNMND